MMGQLVELVDASKYNRVDSKILRTPFALDNPTLTREVNIEVGSPSYWFGYPRGIRKKDVQQFWGVLYSF